MKKNIKVNVRTQRVSPGKLYESVTITAEELQKAKRIIEEVCTIDYFIRNNTEKNEIISIQPKYEDEKENSKVSNALLPHHSIKFSQYKCIITETDSHLLCRWLSVSVVFNRNNLATKFL
ncbi:hypothetical protein P2S20_23520 [Escherichia coli]